MWNEQAYLDANTDVARAVKNGVYSSGWAHYQSNGQTEGRALAPVSFGTVAYTSFNDNAYLAANPDVARAVTAGTITGAWEHFTRFGFAEGRTLAPATYGSFNEQAYLDQNLDVAAAVKAGTFATGWDHYTHFGQAEGRLTAPPTYGSFNDTAYLVANPDVAAAIKAGTLLTAWQHYLYWGATEGRPLVLTAYQNFGATPNVTNFTLTTAADVVNGTAGNDTITGIFGGTATYTTADSIDGKGAGDFDTLALTAAAIATSPAAVTVKNIEAITVRDLYGATFDATLVENAPSITFTDTLAGQTSSVDGGALASVMGLTGKGNLDVDYLTTTGTADTSKLSLTSTGTDATTRSTVTVADSNTIEAVEIATSGTNFVTLAAGTAAKSVKITGNGTNDFDISAATAVAGVVTIDASAATGANTFKMGGTLNTTDVIKGGTGADTVSATFGLATLVKPTMTSVETFKADFDATAIVDLSGSTGLTKVILDGSSENQELIKASSSLATLNVTSQADTNNTVDVSYLSTSKGALAVNLGTTASTAADVTLADLNVTNSTGFALNTLNTKVYNVDAVIDLNGDQSAISYNVATDSDLYTKYVDVAAGDVGAVNMTVGANSIFSGGVYLEAGDMGPVTITAGTGTTTDSYFETDAGSIGDLTVDAKGEYNGTIYVSGGGNMGNVSISLDGDDAVGSYLGLAVSGGSIGDIDITASNGAALDMYVSANSYQFDDSEFSATGTDGNIGNVTVNVTEDSEVNLYIGVSGGGTEGTGDIGNIDITVDGRDAVGYFDFENMYVSGDVNGDGTDNGEYVRGGNIGDVTFTVIGQGCSAGLEIGSSGGNIGNITISADNEATAHFWISGAAVDYAYSGGATTTGINGNIGDVTLSVGTDANVSGYITSNGGNIGNVSVTVTGNAASGGLNLEAVFTSGDTNQDGFYENLGGGNIGTITLDINGSDANYKITAEASGGSIGAVTMTVEGTNASGYINIDSFVGSYESGATGGNIGVTTITAGADTSFGLDYDAATVIGDIEVMAGDNVSGSVYITSTYGDVDTTSTGDILVTMGNESTFDLQVSGYIGNVGQTMVTMGTDAFVSANFNYVSGGSSVDNVSITTGDNGYVTIGYTYVSGSIGDNTIETGLSSDVYFDITGNNYGGVGMVTLVGGDINSDAEVHLNNGYVIDSFAGVDAAGWLGSIDVDLSDVALGTTITVGADGSTILGSQGADNIFLGAGVDSIAFDNTTPEREDIFNFQKTKDILDVDNFVTGGATAVAADAAALDDNSTDITNRAFVFANGANGTGAEAIANYADLTDVASFLNAAFTNVDIADHFVALINDGSTTAYLYDVTATTTGVVAADITELAVVNANGVLTATTNVDAA